MARKKIERNISYDDIRDTYYVNLDYGKDQSGTRIKKTVTCKTKTEARKILRDHESKKDKQEAIFPKKITVAQWLDFWMDNYVNTNCEATTIYAYKNIINNHIDPYFENKEIQTLAPIDIQKYYTYELTEVGLSPNTVKKHHVLLKTALKAAYTSGIVSKNPLDFVEAPKEVEKNIHYYKLEDLQRLLEVSEGTRFELPVKLGGLLGMRREEMCGLKWENVNLDDCTLCISVVRTAAGADQIIKNPKTKTSHRTLKFDEGIKESFLREKEKQKQNKKLFPDKYTFNDFVLVNPLGVPYRPNYLSEMFTRFLEKENLPPLTLHGLRHTFASVANSAGMSLFDISKALGHSSPSVTGNVYTHVFFDAHENVTTAVSNAATSKKAKK